MADPKLDPAPADIDERRIKLLPPLCCWKRLGKKPNHSNDVEAASIILPVNISIFIIT